MLGKRSRGALAPRRWAKTLIKICWRHNKSNEREIRVKRRFRLTKETDFKRVRNLGKSYAHPLVVLVSVPVETQAVRVGVAASRTLGGAVERNRARRILREIVRPLLPRFASGWDLILIARRPLLSASFQDIQHALARLLERARLIDNG